MVKNEEKLCCGEAMKFCRIKGQTGLYCVKCGKSLPDTVDNVDNVNNVDNVDMELL